MGAGVPPVRDTETVALPLAPCASMSELGVSMKLNPKGWTAVDVTVLVCVVEVEAGFVVTLVVTVVVTMLAEVAVDVTVVVDMADVVTVEVVWAVVVVVEVGVVVVVTVVDVVDVVVVGVVELLKEVVEVEVDVDVAVEVVVVEADLAKNAVRTLFWVGVKVRALVAVPSSQWPKVTVWKPSVVMTY